MSVEQYRNRFFNLMESTIGDVKPLITEQGFKPSPGEIVGVAKLELGGEYVFKYFENGKEKGEVTMSPQSSRDENHYELIATENNNKFTLINGEYKCLKLFIKFMFIPPGTKTYYLELKSGPF